MDANREEDDWKKTPRVSKCYDLNESPQNAFVEILTSQR